MSITTSTTVGGQSDSDRENAIRDQERRAEERERLLETNPELVEQSAVDINAGITRDTWDHYLRTFAPLEDKANDLLLDPETNRQFRARGLEVATNTVNNSFDRGDSRLATIASRGNQQRSARQEHASERLNAIGRTSATVAARNQTRRYIDEAELTYLGG